MKTNLPTHMRELTGNETISVAGGLVIGAIPGYVAPLPASLFVNGYTYTIHADGTATFQNNYVGASGAVY